eukprot:UN32875
MGVVQLVLLRRYQYSQKKIVREIEPYYPKIFPGLLRVLTIALQNNQFFITKTILRCFLSPFVLQVPEYFHQQNITSQWMSIMLKILQIKLPSNIDKDKIPDICKCRKWTINIFFRIYANYGRVAYIAKNKEDLKKFAQYWGSTHKKGILEKIFGILKDYSDQKFVYHKTLIQAYGFVHAAVDDGVLFPLMRPHLNFLLHSCCVRSIRLGEEDLQIWQEDPSEWSRICKDDENPTPRKSALQVFLRVIQIRTRFVLQPTLKFIENSLDNKAKTKDAILMKEATMQLFGEMVTILTDVEELKVSTQKIMESIIIRDLENESEIIRARAADLVGKFNMLKYNTNLSKQVIACLLKNMQDKSLVVRVEAATALSSLMLANHFLKFCRPHITTILENFLKLTDELGSGHMVSTLSVLVDALGPNVVPYATHLMKSLIKMFISLYNEAYGKGKEVVNEESYDAAIGCFGSFQVLLHSCREQPKILHEMQPILSPIITNIFNSTIIDFTEDCYSCLSTFFTNCDPPSPWCYEQFLNIMDDFFKGKANLLKEMLDPLCSLIANKPDMFVSYKNGLCVTRLVNTIENIMIDENDNFASIAVKNLVCCLLLNCRGKIDKYIPEILTPVVERMGRNCEDLDTMNFATILAVICWYNPTIFPQKCANELTFLLTIGKQLDWFDRRIVLLCFCSILSLNVNDAKKYSNIIQKVFVGAWDLLIYSKENELKCEDQQVDSFVRTQKSLASQKHLVDVAENEDLTPLNADSLEQDVNSDFAEFLQMMEEDDINFNSPIDSINEVREFYKPLENV